MIGEVFQDAAIVVLALWCSWLALRLSRLERLLGEADRDRATLWDAQQGWTYVPPERA